MGAEIGRFEFFAVSVEGAVVFGKIFDAGEEAGVVVAELGVGGTNNGADNEE